MASSPEAWWKRVGIHVVADDDLLQAREIASEVGGLEVEEGPVTTLALWQECNPDVSNIVAAYVAETSWVQETKSNQPAGLPPVSLTSCLSKNQLA